MTVLLAIIGALALSAIPLVLGWRRTYGEAQMARQMGVAPPEKRIDLEKMARQTGTGLALNQIMFGFLTWAGGGLVAGLSLGTVPAVLFGIAGGLIYAGSLSDLRQSFRLQQAKDILRGLSVVETLLTQGRTLQDALDGAARSVGPDGRLVLEDLVLRLRTAATDQAAQAVKEWTTAWDNPAVDIVATSLLASIEGRIEISPLIANLRTTLGAVVEVLSRARAASKGIEWQARFLALFPPGVLVVIAVMTPENGRLYAQNPIYLLPVLLGSGLSYWLSMRMVRNGLSIEASMGLQSGQAGMIQLDRMGKVL
jgi:Flp pilus assembly protein TadB